MGIDMSLSAEGQTLDLPISMDMSMDTINEPLTARATMNMNVMQQAGGRGVLPRAAAARATMMYANMTAAAGRAAAVDETELGQFSAVDGVEFYLQCASAFEKVGEEEGPRRDGLALRRRDTRPTCSPEAVRALRGVRAW